MANNQLTAMSKVEIKDVDKTQLADISTIQIDPALNSIKRMENYLKQIKNPYCFLCEDTPVRIRFATDKKTLASLLGDYFISLK